MNRFVYLDNNATTKVDKEVLSAIQPYLNENFGNPSSLYGFGKDVKKAIKNARKMLAKLLNCNADEIVFTSGASESNVTAIMSAIHNNPNKKHIITTKVEHSSILETMKSLENQGYKVTYLNVDEYGRLDLNELQNSISEDVCLISVMLANNELGNIYPIKKIGEIAKEHNILFHCDAVQAVGKIPVDVKDLNVDTLSLSGHKLHALKGVGALYVKNGVNLNSLVFGHQESGRRGGTENVVGIVSLGKAVELLLENNFEHVEYIKNLRDYFEKKIQTQIDGVKVYGDPANRISNTSLIAFKNVDALELMFMLESQGIYVSTGSACNSESAKPSDVLVACKANLKEFSPIRVSLSKYTIMEDIDYLVECLKKNINKLRR